MCSLSQFDKKFHKHLSYLNHIITIYFLYNEILLVNQGVEFRPVMSPGNQLDMLPYLHNGVNVLIWNCMSFLFHPMISRKINQNIST